MATRSRGTRAGAWLLLFLASAVARLCVGVAQSGAAVASGARRGAEAEAAPSEAANASPWKTLARRWKPEAEWRQVYDAFASFDRVSEFRALFDAVPVRALGAPSRDYRAWFERAWTEGKPVPAEPLPSLRERFSSLNSRFPSALADGAFQTLAIDPVDGLEVVVGDETGGLGLAPAGLAQWIAAKSGRVFAGLRPDVQARLLALTERWTLDRLDERAALWLAIAPSMQSREARATVNGCRLAFVAENRLWVLSDGDDEQVDSALRRIDAAEAHASARVEELFR